MEANASHLIAARDDIVLARIRRVGPLATAGGAAVVAIAAFLPWVRTGSATRSSFGLVRSAELLGVLDGPASVGVRAWYLVPLLVAALWTAAVVQNRPIVIAVGLVLGLTAMAVALIVEAAPLHPGPGPQIALAGSALTLTGVALTAFQPRGTR